MHDYMGLQQTFWSMLTSYRPLCIQQVIVGHVRFVINCYDRYQSVMYMMQQLGWPTLEERRNQLKLTMMYKIINGLVFIQQNLP